MTSGEPGVGSIWAAADAGVAQGRAALSNAGEDGTAGTRKGTLLLAGSETQ